MRPICEHTAKLCQKRCISLLIRPFLVYFYQNIISSLYSRIKVFTLLFQPIQYCIIILLKLYYKYFWFLNCYKTKCKRLQNKGFYISICHLQSLLDDLMQPTVLSFTINTFISSSNHPFKTKEVPYWMDVCSIFSRKLKKEHILRHEYVPTFKFLISNVTKEIIYSLQLP